MSEYYDFYVIGLGVSIPDHVTSEARSAMAICSKLFSVVQENPRLWLPLDKVEQVEVVNLLGYYTEGSLRTDNYQRAAEMVLATTGPGKPVGYVTYGNPMAYDSVAQLVVRKAVESGRSVRVVPGISSLDSILCDLQVDLAPAIQVFEASWLLAFEIVPRIDTHLILVQMGSFGSYRTHYSQRLDGGALTDLIHHLMRVYPGHHRVSLVRSAASKGHPAKVSSFSLNTLPNATAEELSGSSLYIPALTQPVPNAAVLERLKAN